MFKNIFIIIFCILFFFSCSKKDKIEIDNVLDQEKVEDQLLEVYKQGMKALKEGDAFYAVKKFNEAEIIYPKSKWAMKSSLMTIYAYYSQNYFSDAVFYAERHLNNYPQDPNIPYVHYLIAICYFEQIEDKAKDLEPLLISKKKFEYIMKNFPNTDFATDAKYKLNLIIEILAAKEMYIGRYYMKTEKWIGAIKRFQVVVDKYNQTSYIEEALHRLVEIYYKIGMLDEAKKTASVLAYNYETSEWYKNSYKLFDKSYKIINLEKEKKKSSIIKKFKSLFIENEGTSIN